MESNGYIYLPKRADDAAVDLIDALIDAGICVSHLGKSDPPKNWKGSKEDIVSMVTSGADSTRWTFGRDKEKGIEFTIELHGDHRWTHDTISISTKDEKETGILVDQLSNRLKPYMGIVGVSGMGKNQDWDIRYISEDCPTDLVSKIKGAYQVGAHNSGGCAPSA